MKDALQTIGFAVIFALAVAGASAGMLFGVPAYQRWARLYEAETKRRVDEARSR